MIPSVENMRRLDEENKKLIIKCIETMTREVNARRDIDCMKRIIKNQATKLDAYRKLFWRIYWK